MASLKDFVSLKCWSPSTSHKCHPSTDESLVNHRPISSSILSSSIESPSSLNFCMNEPSLLVPSWLVSSWIPLIFSVGSPPNWSKTGPHWGSPVCWLNLQRNQSAFPAWKIVTLKGSTGYYMFRAKYVCVYGCIWCVYMYIYIHVYHKISLCSRPTTLKTIYIPIISPLKPLKFPLNKSIKSPFFLEKSPFLLVKSCLAAQRDQGLLQTAAAQRAALEDSGLLGWPFKGQGGCFQEKYG